VPAPRREVRGDLLFVAISGETVLDYQLACKKEFAGPKVWVAGTATTCSRTSEPAGAERGGYEARDGIVHQLVRPRSPGVEATVMGGVRKVVREVSGR